MKSHLKLLLMTECAAGSCSAQRSLVFSQDKLGYVTTGWEMLPFLPYKVGEAPYEN